VAEDNAHVKVYARMSAALSHLVVERWKILGLVASTWEVTDPQVYPIGGDIQPHGVMSDSGQYSSPAWSPDGKLLAFVHFGLGIADIVIFDAQRSPPGINETLCSPIRIELSPSRWSPDGKSLVVDDKDQESEPFSLYLVYIESGQRVRLTYPDSDIIAMFRRGFSRRYKGRIHSRHIPLSTRCLCGECTWQNLSTNHLGFTLISDVGWKTGASLVFAADHGDGFNFGKSI